MVKNSNGDNNEVVIAEVKETGQTRQNARLAAKKKQQDEFYKLTPSPEISRQFRRRLKRLVDKARNSELKKAAIKNRRRKSIPLANSDCAEIVAGE